MDSGSICATTGIRSSSVMASLPTFLGFPWRPLKGRFGAVRTRNEPADCPALRPDGPRSGRSVPVGRTVRACADQIRVPSFVLRLLAKIAGLARNQLCKGSSPPPL
jgi:hypothetical protein